MAALEPSGPPWEPQGAEAGGQDPCACAGLVQARGPPALGGREAARWGSRVLHSRSSGQNLGVSVRPGPTPDPRPPRPHLHAHHPEDDTPASGDGPWRKGRLCPEHGAQSTACKCARLPVPTDLRGVGPHGSGRWQEPGQGETWPRLQAPVRRGCGVWRPAVSGPGSPRPPCDPRPPAGMLLAVLLYHGRLPRLFQRNLLYSQKSKYRVPRGRPVPGPGGSQTPKEGSRGRGPP